LDAKTVEAYLDVDPGTDVHAVTDVLAQRLGFDEYEVTAVEWLRIPPSRSPLAPVAEPSVPTTPPAAVPNPTPTPTEAPTATAPLAPHAPSTVAGDRALVRVHPGTITQVLVKPGGRALSVQVRHRRNEAVAAIAVGETADTVEVAASVGTPEDDRRADFASFGVTFSWADADLARELGARRIIHSDTGVIHTESAPVPEAGIGPVVGEPPAVAEEPTVQTESPQQPENPRQPVAPQYRMSEYRMSDDAPPRDTEGHARRTPFMLMLVVAFAVALFLSRRTRHR
jgi:hypothetical protein